MMKKIICVCILVFFAGCSAFDDVQRNEGVSLYKGFGALYNELASMKNPQGILPDSVSFPATGIVSRSAVDYHEFFVFDKDKCS